MSIPTVFALIVNIHYFIAIAIVVLDKWIESGGPQVHRSPAGGAARGCGAGASGSGSSQAALRMRFIPGRALRAPVPTAPRKVGCGLRALSEARRGLWWGVCGSESALSAAAGGTGSRHW